MLSFYIKEKRRKTTTYAVGTKRTLMWWKAYQRFHIPSPINLPPDFANIIQGNTHSTVHFFHPTEILFLSSNWIYLVINEATVKTDYLFTKTHS